NEPFDPEEFDLWGEIGDAFGERWDSLKETFTLAALSNPIEASKGDGEMDTGTMGTMGAKFGSGIAAYSYLIFVLLYVPCVSVMGAIARETSRGWMTFSILWGLNIAYSLAALFYQVATFSEHPQSSGITIAAVVIFNLILFILLRNARSRLTINLSNKPSLAKQCCSKGSCH
ncbi:ferrous iron transport protein B, partial [Klebsiella variicola subsp. variicola]